MFPDYLFISYDYDLIKSSILKSKNSYIGKQTLVEVKLKKNDQIKTIALKACQHKVKFSNMKP